MRFENATLFALMTWAALSASSSATQKEHLKRADRDFGELRVACWRGDEEKVEALLAAHPEFVNARISGINILEEAATHQQHAIVAMLETRRATTGSQLLDAIIYNDIDEVRRLLSANAATLDAPIKPDGVRPLHWAAGVGSAEVVKLFLDRGCRPNQKACFGVTPLHYVAMWGNDARCAEILLRAGAEVDATTDLRMTPLIVASDHGHDELAKWLLRNGADVNAKNVRGRSPLHLAANGGHPACIRLLIDWGADLDAKDNEGRTALDFAKNYAIYHEDGPALVALFEKAHRRARIMAWVKLGVGAGSALVGLVLVGVAFAVWRRRRRTARTPG